MLKIIARFTIVIVIVALFTPYLLLSASDYSTPEDLCSAAHLEVRYIVGDADFGIFDCVVPEED